MKRMTETTKWSDPWFMELPPKWKLLWLYLVDNCDNAGVWQPNMKLASVQIGENIDATEAAAILQGRVTILESGKWHVVKFVAYQYGQLSEDCRPHKQVIDLQRHHKINTLSIGYPKGIHTLQDKDKDKDKDQGIGVQGKGKAEITATAQAIYDAYPRKVGKPAAVKAIAKALAKIPAEELLARVQAFAESRKGQDPNFTPHPATWFNQERYADDMPPASQPQPTGKTQSPPPWQKPVAEAPASAKSANTPNPIATGANSSGPNKNHLPTTSAGPRSRSASRRNSPESSSPKATSHPPRNHEPLRPPTARRARA
jgi:hypothetical protein